VATTEEEAKQKAAREWGEPLLVNVLAKMSAEVLRPYEEKPGAGTYELYNKQTGDAVPDTEFSARNEADQATRLQDYINHGQHGMNAQDASYAFGVRPVVSSTAHPTQQGVPGLYKIFTTGGRLIAGDTYGSDEDALERAQHWAQRRGEDVVVRNDQGQEVGRVSSSGAITPTASASDPLRPTGPGPWEIYNRATGNSAANLSVDGRPITDRSAAQRMAMGSIAAGQHDLYGVRTIGTGSRANIGTQTDMENRLGMPSQSTTANYAVVDRQTLDPVFRFHADNRYNANRIYGEWLAAAGLPQTTEDYGFQEIRPQSGQRSDRTDGSNIDYSFRDLFGTNPTTDQQQGGIVDVAPDVAQNFPQASDNVYGATGRASSAPPGNSFSGQWKVIVNGQEVWRFRGVGNSQADANRIAAQWLRDNGQGVSGEGYEVVPVMI
jgi:hypothetical protein